MPPEELIIFQLQQYKYRFATYANPKNHALFLLDPNNEQEYCVASINVPIQLAQDEIAIKTTNDRDGMIKALIDAKLVAWNGKLYRSDYVDYPICTLLVIPHCDGSWEERPTEEPITQP